MEATACGLQCDSNPSTTIKLSKAESETLQFRVGFRVEFLCQAHYDDQFSRYKGWHGRKCSDPCKRHKRVMKSNLREVSLCLAKKVKKKSEYLVIPGQSICLKCENFLVEIIDEDLLELDEESEDKSDDEVGETREYGDKNIPIEVSNKQGEAEFDTQIYEDENDTPEFDTPPL